MPRAKILVPPLITLENKFFKKNSGTFDFVMLLEGA